VDAFEDRNIRADLGDDGVLVATIDMPGRSMNVFSADLMDSLDRLIDRVAAASDVGGAIIASGKSAFIAGADLEMVRHFTERARRETPAVLHRLCGRLGRIFRRLESSRKPYVAAIQGLALGGGLELALACHERVVADTAQVGLPEVKLGLLPGAGGTQRLPRLIGKRAALRMMLLGEPQAAAGALALGIVHDMVPGNELLSGARRRATALARYAVTAPWDRADWRAPGNVHDMEQSAECDAFADELDISREQRRLYPAYDAILSCVVGGWPLSMDAACDWEMDRFVELIRDPVAGNMIRTLFLDRQRAAKAIPPAVPRRPRAAVLGDAAASVAQLLKASRIEIMENDADSDILVLTAPARCSNPQAYLHALAWLRAPTDTPHAFGVRCGVWVSEATGHGRAAEISMDVAESDASHGLALAGWLRATPLVSRGGVLLLRLAAVSATESLTTEERLLAVALEAARAWCDGVRFDTGIADSAAVVAGLHPPYTGGPFEYLRQRGAVAIREAAAILEAAPASGGHRGHLFAVPERLDEFLAALNAGAE
jgi:3-hydroxyacyl-CoA dehydrogenase/enoyl-CoA hydratase/3-hydroxybutyryl-CoA epimerase